MLDRLGLLRQHAEAFAAAVEDGDPQAPVAHCPGWTVRDLADHLGGIHQWAAHAVVAGTPDLEPEPAGPLGAAALAGWYRRHAGHLLEVLAARPPEASAWTLDRTDPTAGFWWRRQLHEVRLHRWDLEHALGDPTPFDPALAWDGVLEVVEVMHPRQVRLGRTAPLTATLRLVATDGPWSAELGGGEPVELPATAELLLRLLWHRADPTDAGADARVAGLLAGAVTP